MLKLFTYSMAVMGPASLEIGVCHTAGFVVTSDNETSAKKRIHDDFAERFPPDEGWSAVDVLLHEIPLNALIRFPDDALYLITLVEGIKPVALTAGAEGEKVWTSLSL